jgi:alcohol dehydrogenase (cytochrome c)
MAITQSRIAVGVALIGAASYAFAQSTPTFTDRQAASGKVAFEQSCARCHGANLDDGEFGPPLRGRAFLDHWAHRSVADLYSQLKRSMPPDGPGTLSDSMYVQLIAYLLSTNGVAPGSHELTSELPLLSAMQVPGTSGEKPPLGPSGGLAPGVVLPVWPARPNPLTRLTPVTDALLRNPSDSDWLSWRRTANDSGFSPLRQITAQNVSGLRLAWSLTLPAGPNEATPLVHDGVLFVHSFNDHVMALEAATGIELWHYARELPEGTSGVVQRNMALYGERLYVGTSDAHVIALQAKSGKLVWDRAVADPKLWRVSGGPLVAKGRVMQGVVGRAAGGAFIVGLDAGDGQRLWTFNSIAQSGDPGERSWNATPLAHRNGGSVWTAGSYDSELNLAFFGPGQTYDTAPLQHPLKRRGLSNEGLYLDSTVALDPDTGRVVWYHQHLPNDQWDYDWAFERLVTELPVKGTSKKLVVTSGKLGIFEALEADSGKFAFAIDMGIQDLITAIDPVTGAKTIDPRKYPAGQPITVCPHAGGGRSWLPTSYNAATHTVFVPMVESCMDMIPTGVGEHGSLSSGYRWTLRPRPGSDGKYGRLQAVNLDARKTVWTTRQRAPQTSGVLDTAGGVLFAGALDRSFTAYDDATGEPLWKAGLTDVPSSAPISFAVEGKQYVAMVVGFGGAQAITFPVLVPEIKLPAVRSSSIWVFELP